MPPLTAVVEEDPALVHVSRLARAWHILFGPNQKVLCTFLRRSTLRITVRSGIPILTTNIIAVQVSYRRSFRKRSSILQSATDRQCLRLM